jgi:hypothetical protein
MTTDRALMQQALALLSDAQRHHYALKHNETDAFVTALRARLSVPEPEPVAWQERHLISSTGQWTHWYECRPRMAHQPPEQLEPNGLMYQWRALYTAPPTRRPLAPVEIATMWRKFSSEEGFITAQFVCKFARVIERAHNITGDNDE